MSEEQTPVEQTEQQTPETPAVEQPKYTDKQLNDLIAKNSGKELKKTLDAYGLKSAEEIAELVKLKQSQMSESEKNAARIAELEALHKAATDKADAAEAKVEAISKGVPADKAAKVVKLAMSGDYEGDSIADKIGKVLDEFPEFIAKQGGADFGGKTDGATPNQEDELRKKMRAVAGLK